ncbi:regulatory-associated protein of TOR1 [Artemisia annua]|uniref:Regulatory-associated protein of TOR1 n=1 Tax=Artemisia annua TaxID=35608 RepID=A0A2U1Q4X0_ARTAN|nr:regulatory-associated protein of TOR1 [Artemisia annua]
MGPLTISLQHFTSQLFMDGSLRLYYMQHVTGLVCVTQPHTRRAEQVLGIGFQPGLDPAKKAYYSPPGLLLYFQYVLNASDESRNSMVEEEAENQRQ